MLYDTINHADIPVNYSWIASQLDFPGCGSKTNSFQNIYELLKPLLKSKKGAELLEIARADDDKRKKTIKKTPNGLRLTFHNWLKEKYGPKMPAYWDSSKKEPLGNLPGVEWSLMIAKEDAEIGIATLAEGLSNNVLEKLGVPFDRNSKFELKKNDRIAKMMKNKKDRERYALRSLYKRSINFEEFFTRLDERFTIVFSKN